MLEVVEGRQPFPRVAPPYRRGLDPNDQPARRSASAVHLAGPGGTDESPALVDNVETLANVPSILAEGVEWFRSVGTSESPGTLLATITGRTRRHGVGEVPMGTPLGEIIDVVGGGARPGRTLLAAISGVANAIVPASLFDTPATYEDMHRIGFGLGAGGFIVFDDESDLVAVAHAAARFLAVESCGQCEPCKLDGLAISGHLDTIRSSNASERDCSDPQKLQTVTHGARCYLAQQQEQVVASILSRFPRRCPPSTSPSIGRAPSVNYWRRCVRHRRWTGGARQQSPPQAAGLDVRSDRLGFLPRRPLHQRAGAPPPRPRSPRSRWPSKTLLTARRHRQDPFAQIRIGHRRIHESIDQVRSAGTLVVAGVGAAHTPTTTYRSTTTSSTASCTRCSNGQPVTPATTPRSNRDESMRTSPGRTTPPFGNPTDHRPTSMSSPTSSACTRGRRT